MHSCQVAFPDGLTRLGQTSVNWRTSVVAVNDRAGLLEFIPAWEELAAFALEPNVFYEHWMLLPALEAFATDTEICFVLVLLHDVRNPAAKPKLAGLFPLRRRSGFNRLPVSVVGLWRYIHCYLCTPLIRADAAYECVVELTRWLRSEGGRATLIEFANVSADGPFSQVLNRVFSDRGLAGRVTDSYRRGLLNCSDGLATVTESVLSSQLRRTLRRKERRLNELGRVEHVELQPGDDIQRWIDDFLRIEASGWKGRQGSAMACSETNRRFFTEVLVSAFQRGRLIMIGIDVDGQPIARRCSFAAGNGSFAFKTAFDETFSHFSPGVMLEVDNVRMLSQPQGVQWMDSCTDPENFCINRVSNARRTIQSLVVGGGSYGDLLVSALPVLRWIRRHALIRHVKDQQIDASTRRAKDAHADGNADVPSQL